jgi:hypothetical protein
MSVNAVMCNALSSTRLRCGPASRSPELTQLLIELLMSTIQVCHLLLGLVPSQALGAASLAAVCNSTSPPAPLHVLRHSE